MSNFWIKMAVFAVIIIALVVLVKNFSDSPPKEKTGPQTIYETWQEDDKKHRSDPKIETPPTKQIQTSQKQKPQTPTTKQTQTTQTQPAQQPIETVKRQFRELTETENIEAERLFEVALSGRKMGRLPGPGYKLMVDNCRRIIQKFPGSVYDYKARRLLADIPEKYRKIYNITPEEIDLSK